MELDEFMPQFYDLYIFYGSVDLFLSFVFDWKACQKCRGA